MVSDRTPQKLDEATEAALCEALANLIEQYGFATVQDALNAVARTGIWVRGG
jgi:hypothetical protein